MKVLQAAPAAYPYRSPILGRRSRRRGQGPFRFFCLPVLLLVDAVDPPLLLLAFASGAAVGAGLLVGQLAPQLQEAVVAGLIQQPLGDRLPDGTARLVHVGAVGERAALRQPGDVVEGGVHVGALGPQLQLADTGAVDQQAARWQRAPAPAASSCAGRGRRPRARG